MVVTATAFGSAKAPTTQKASFTAALVSDIGKFTDKGFNQNQLKGLNTAKSKLGVGTLALQSNSTSDYAPNFNTAIRKGAKLVVAAGFLLAPTEATYAKKFPNVNFAITDYTVHTAPFATKTGKVLPAFKNVEGLTYNANESGCLVGVLAAKMAKKMGGNTVGAVGGLKIPPVDIWIAGYKYCVDKVAPGMKVLVQYSNDFVATDKCQTVAQNEIAQGAKVLFQVAGGCGLGTLKAAADAKLWGIGVDVDQYNDSAARADERCQASRQRRLRRDPAGAGRQVPGWLRPRVQPEERWHGRRQDQPLGPEGLGRADELVQDEDHQRHAAGADGPLGRRKSCECERAGLVPALLRSV